MTGRMDEAPKPATDLLRALYGDLDRPGVPQAGKALGRVLGLGPTLLWTLALASPGAGPILRANLEAFRERLEDLDLEDVVPAAPEIGVPVADKLGYVTDPGLGGLYLNLLAKASGADTAFLAHPGFVPMIASLSPDEAALLPYCDQERPFLEARLTNRTAGSWRTLNPLLTNLEDEADLLFPENLVAYLSNLEGLGLLTIRPDLYLASAESRYQELERAYRPIFATVAHNPGTERLNFERGKLVPTPFGKLFLRACLD